MTRKKTQKEFECQVYESKGNRISCVGAYVDTNTPIEFRCNACGDIVLGRPSVVLRSKKEHTGLSCFCSGNKPLNTADFIKRAILRHGDKYDYSQTVVVDSNQPVVVSCRACNTDFPVLPNNHQRPKHPSGCPHCAPNAKVSQADFDERLTKAKKGRLVRVDPFRGMRHKINFKCLRCNEIKEGWPEVAIRDTSGPGISCICSATTPLDTDDFIVRAIDNFGDKFTYDHVKYKNMHIKVKIFCTIHEQFFSVTPANFLHGGKACNKCSLERQSEQNRMPYDDFDRRLFEIHGFEIRRLASYKNLRQSTLFRCNKCGDQVFGIPANLIKRNPNKIECECSGNKHYDQERFIKRAKEVHGTDVYDWSKTRFKDMRTNVKVRCRRHDFIFEVPGTKHIHARQGCPKCVGKYKRNTAEFITEATAIHYDDYDYSKVDFRGVDKPVTIICNRCGLEFQQLAYSHLNNSGCACCSESKGERIIRYFLDENEIRYEREKRFDGCRDKGKLPFDFCLPEHRILIEFDGVQHYEPGHFFGGEPGLTEVQKRDEIKTSWAKDNDWQLIRIRYDEDAEVRLRSVLADFC